MGNLVRYQAENGVATLTMCDPPGNNYTHEMLKEMDEGILKARFDDSVHVIVLTGDGEKFFSSGANIKMLASVTPQFKYYFCLHANETLMRLEQTPKLVIAALNGHTVGGGLEIAMAADIRIARKSADFKIGLPEVALGVLPGTGGTQRLTRLIGTSKAIELMVEGTNFSFDQAEQMGIINKQIEAANTTDFMAKIYDYAKSFVPPGKAAFAVGRIKRSCQSGGQIPLEYGLALERELQAELFNSSDAKEGLKAYTEKRKANFQAK